MSHREYAKERGRRDPRFQAELDAAAAELAIGELGKPPHATLDQPSHLQVVA